MFRALQNMLGAQPWRCNHEVWAEVLAYSPETGQATFLFTTTVSMSRDPQFLSRWGWQVRAMFEDLYPPRTPTDAMLRNWVKGGSRVNNVDYLLRETDLGFDLFGATVVVPGNVLGRDYDGFDHNGSVLRLDCRGPLPVVIGAPGAANVASERLASLYRTGARPLVGARVQANHTLYGQGTRSAPAMVAFSFDPGVSPLKLQEVAQMIHELKSSDTQNPVLLAAAAGPRASDEFWFYHRRFRIPPELAEGRVIYAGDIWIHRPYLPDGFFSDRTPRLIPVLAQPGETGGVELIAHEHIGQLFPAPQQSLFRLKM
jgi:hypothetical protein